MPDPTETAARALRAMRALAADLAEERRTSAVLRRENVALRAENERLTADRGLAPRVAELLAQTAQDGETKPGSRAAG